MDIRNWPIDRIMQLPDFCFGRRWPVFCNVEGDPGGPAWDISELGLPELAVIWQFGFWSNVGGTDVVGVRVALGDQLPTTVAMMTALEPLLFGLGIQGPDPRTFDTPFFGELVKINMRMPVRSGGRRLVLEVTSLIDKSPDVFSWVTVSSVPREVPDWLISAQGRSL